MSKSSKRVGDPVVFSVNGIEQRVERDDADMLIDHLHEVMHLTGTKFGCGIGSCRACTVLVRRGDAPWRPTLACSTPLRALDGLQVETVEGLSADGEPLSPVQRAFLDGFSFQCGYCTPGFAMAGTSLIRRIRRQAPKPEQIPTMVDDTIGGHYCRCTGYSKYRSALTQLALREVSETGRDEP